MRWVRALLLVLLFAAAALLVLGYWSATSDPVVRTTRIALPDWPSGARPLRVLLVSDIHVVGPDMPPSRVARLVEQMNALKPDLMLLAGDFASDRKLATRRYSLSEAIRPLAALHAPLGRYAVLGNHDHWRDAAQARRALSAAGIRLLDNDAVEVGPLALGGLDDPFTRHQILERTIARMRALPGAKLLLSHSPDPFADLPADVSLMLAGHTHCGQIVLPWIGPLATASDYGDRFLCGIVRERGRTLVVGAGLGTSLVPLRIGARPDMWLIELGPRRGEARSPQ
ncbi:MAG: metallophosphoesterase [Allosphingosinicella sp.]